jgi:hypothetical protein
MSHWLLTFSSFATGWSIGAAWTWYIQRGQCRSCRIRFSVRRLMHPIAQRIILKADPARRELLRNAVTIMEVAIAFAPVASAKIAWQVFLNWWRMKHGVRKAAKV